MPCLAPILGTYPIQGNSHSQMDYLPSVEFCILYSDVLQRSPNRFLLPQIYLDGLITQAQMPSCSCMHLSFVPKYKPGLPTEPGFNHTYWFSLFNTLSGSWFIHRCHPHNIRCKSNITQPSSTGWAGFTRLIPQFLYALCKICSKWGMCTH